MGGSFLLGQGLNGSLAFKSGSFSGGVNFTHVINYYIRTYFIDGHTYAKFFTIPELRHSTKGDMYEYEYYTLILAKRPRSELFKGEGGAPTGPV